MNSNPNRVLHGTDPASQPRRGLQPVGAGTKLINMIIHDTVPGNPDAARQSTAPRSTATHLLQRLRRARPRTRPRDLCPERSGQRHQDSLRQHHLRAVRLRHPRLHRQAATSTTSTIEGNTSFNNGGLSTSADGRPTSSSAASGRDEPDHHRPTTRTTRSMHGANNLGLQRGLHEPDDHRQLLRQRHGPQDHQLHGHHDDGQHLLRLDLRLHAVPVPEQHLLLLAARPASRSSSGPTPTKPAAPTSPSTTGTRQTRSTSTSRACSSPGSYYEVRERPESLRRRPSLSGTYDGNPVAFPMTGSHAGDAGRVRPHRSDRARVQRVHPDVDARTVRVLRRPQSEPFHAAIHTVAADGHHGRLRRRRLLPQRLGQPRADGGLPPEGRARRLVRPSRRDRHRFHRRLRAILRRGVDRGARRRGDLVGLRRGRLLPDGLRDAGRRWRSSC